MRDRRERGIRIGPNGGPVMQRNAGRRVLPPLAQIRDTGAGPANRFPCREIQVVGRQVQTVIADPQLQETRVDVDERGPAKPTDDPCRRVVAQAQEQVRLQRDTLEAQASRPHVGPQRVSLVAPERHRVGESVRCEATLQARDGAQLIFDRGFEHPFEPQDLAPELAQTERPVQIDPGLAAPIGVSQGIRHDADGRTHPFSVASAPSNAVSDRPIEGKLRWILSCEVGSIRAPSRAPRQSEILNFPSIARMLFGMIELKTLFFCVVSPRCRTTAWP